MLDPSWVEESLVKQSLTINHVKSADESILLTASTKDLQKFVVEYANDVTAFKDSIILIRK